MYNFLKYVFVGLFVICNLGFVIYVPVQARFDPTSVPNNKVGIHILETTEVEHAAKLVNSGGDWGYVTIPIQPTDRSYDKWQHFLDECKRLHLIPIIRITTIPLGGTWVQGEATDLVDFANFMNSLSWPVGNRYIVLFNEVNRAAEWGGTVDPVSYAKLLEKASIIFHERSADFFLLGPALDDALPNSSTSMSSSNYLRAMQAYDPKIWTYLDGWAAHSYPNPGFTSRPGATGWQSIVGYRSALSFTRAASLPVFITETGWNHQALSEAIAESYWRQGWNIWQNDKKVIAVTPFILQGGAQFSHLSFIRENGELTPGYKVTESLGKVKGEPQLGSPKGNGVEGTSDYKSSDLKTPTKSSNFFIQIENIFRRLFGLPSRGFVQINGTAISVDLALNAKEWGKGLSFKQNLDEGTGMLFVFPSSHIPAFWMKDMNFDIDIIWVKDNKVVDISKNVKKPVNTGDQLPMYSPKEVVNAVLEVPSGYSDRHEIEIGNTLTIIR